MNLPIEAAHREMYWHIASPYRYLIYPLIAVSLGIFAWGLYKKYRFWTGGQADAARFGDWKKRIELTLWEIPFQARVLKEKKGGVIHVLIFWSFALLMLTTAIVFLDVDFKVPVYNGPLYLVVSLMADLAGLALFAGLLMAAHRRYVTRPAKLKNRWDDAFVLLLLGASVATGFLLEGMRIAYTGDPWAAWSPVGYALSLGMGGMEEASVRRAYQAHWWFHFAALFTFIASIPYTKFLHVFTLPANVFFSSTRPKGSLERQDIEEMMNDEAAIENFNVGVSEVKHLSWKQRLDYDACIRCGRCEEVCPSYLNDKPLSPRKLIADLKEFAQNPANQNGGNGGDGQEEERLIVGNAFDVDLVWECRTCRACMEVCPAHIEHVPQMMELRRAEVMMRGRLPNDAAVALKQLERGGNPFGPQEERSNWIRENQIPVVPPGGECEVLFWIGCCTTYDVLKQKVAYNVLSILMEAGIKVGVLGEDENCCGDPGRLLGDENLFQAIVKSQIEMIQSRKFDYMVTHCPHCYSVFKNEYPQFGANFKVVHHTDIIAELIESGRICLDQPVKRRVTYHDPCYLGRYNDSYEKPRDILRAIKGVTLTEMENNRELSRCCGGGGGHYWMDLPTGERINENRLREAIATDADTVAVSCVYCLQMLNDAVKIMDLEETLKVQDISELVVESMGRQAEAKSMKVLDEEEELAA